ncbi:MAG: hypothetical protein PHX87_01005 [Candidatus Peribacteraceae bacterium]|nr:hypothetical protein [Candidatus Peribacteraceae bacterium]MDD5741988.1 hypothetical protein [Candidatus Peribacteraceae bacterium]
MTDLPASIEAYLTEAGFSATEITVVKKLLEGEALTLRELASKTGKSTGVLDAAAKKLIQRRIISRETVNDTPKMLLKSLDPILQWMRRDTEEKLEAMKSRARNFETFINSLKVENKRPEMEYFEGEEGVKKAYGKLLEQQVKEFLHYRPVTVREEEDPLRAFRAQYFRERHRRGIFSRSLAPLTTLGRRFQSRDAFAYRETQLIPESVFPITFEKVIVGETVACFNHSEQRACFLKYPELAHTERTMFELLWRRAKEPPASAGATAGRPLQAQTVAVTLSQSPEPLIPFSTRSLSSLRDFIMSRKSIALFGACALLAAGITFGLWRHNYQLNRDRVKERAMAIAATAAMEFDAQDIDQLHIKADAQKPEFTKLVTHLREIKTRNENIRYVYIDRPIENPDASWEVVADADYGTPDDDLNGDGIIEDFEQLTMPGQIYPHVDPLFQERLQKPAADFLNDEWGEYCDASAPIFDSQGQAIAALFVDIDMKEVRDLTDQSFAWVYYFLGFFLLFVFIRLAAFNRPLFLELLKVLRSRGVLTVLGVCAVIAVGITYGMYQYTLSLMKEQVGEKLMSIAATAAPEFDAKDFEFLRFARDMKRPEYQKVFKKLNEIRDRNRDNQIIYAYIFRPTSDPTLWEFVADADSNYNIPLLSIDFNGDGVLDGADENAWPGAVYDATGQRFVTEGLKGPMIEGFASDKWGTFLTGMAPIHDDNGKPIAVLGIDMNITDFYQQIRNRFVPYLWFGVTFVGLLGMWVGYLVVVANTRR